MKSERDFAIRDARPDEADEVADVILSAYQQYAQSYAPGIWEFYVKDMANVRGRLADSELIVAVRQGSIVGTVTFYSDASRSRLLPAGWAALRFLAVAPSTRGLGIGTALMEECIGRCRERGIMTLGLHTMEFMSAARRIYERLGFQRIPEYDLHPSETTHVLAYSLDL